MTKQRFRILLIEAGLSQRQAAADLGMHVSTVSRWRPNVPPYAAAYALLMASLSAEQQATIRQEMAP